MRTQSRELGDNRVINLGARLAGENLADVKILYFVVIHEKVKNGGETKFRQIESLIETDSLKDAQSAFDNYTGDGKKSFYDLELTDKLKLAFEAGEYFANSKEYAGNSSEYDLDFEEWLHKVWESRI